MRTFRILFFHDRKAKQSQISFQTLKTNCCVTEKTDKTNLQPVKPSQLKTKHKYSHMPNTAY